MSGSLESLFAEVMAGIDLQSETAAVASVDRLLVLGRDIEASDLHLQPTLEGLQIRGRIDGVLQDIGQFPNMLAPKIVARLKVMAGLLTYKSDAPQEGRIPDPIEQRETRLSTFPTLHGERAVVRFLRGPGRFRQLDDLGLPDDVVDDLRCQLGETSGVILLTGPSGSGKSTTIYACLREILDRSRGRRCVMTLEDPIEMDVAGAVQSQINPQAGFDLAEGLRAMLRQDPEVIVVGEIRDEPTALAVYNAAMTGHLVLTTFHAGQGVEAIGRLVEMAIEPYVLRSGTRAILGQRLARRLCSTCKQSTEPLDASRVLGLKVDAAWMAVGCPNCRGTGYEGRIVLAELLEMDRIGLDASRMDRAETEGLAQRIAEAGVVGLRQRARDAVQQGLTSPAEIVRVLGISRRPLDPT